MRELFFCSSLLLSIRRRVGRYSVQPAERAFWLTVWRCGIVASKHRSKQRIQSWLVERVAALLVCDLQEINVHETFHSYGLSSREAVELSGDLETWLGLTLAPTLLWDYPTIERLVDYLAHSSTQITPPAAIEPASQEIAPIPGETPTSSIQREPIALIGIGCRFPGASGPEAFWQLLCEGRDAITEVTPERWDPTLFYDPAPLQA